MGDGAAMEIIRKVAAADDGGDDNASEDDDGTYGVVIAKWQRVVP